MFHTQVFHTIRTLKRTKLILQPSPSWEVTWRRHDHNGLWLEETKPHSIGWRTQLQRYNDIISAAMFFVPRLPRAFCTCAIWFTLSRATFGPIDKCKTNFCWIVQIHADFTTFYHPCYFRDTVISCEVCVHIKHVSKSVNSAVLWHEDIAPVCFLIASRNQA